MEDNQLFIENISNETADKLRRKSASALPNNPTAGGYKADEIRRAFWDPFLGDKESLLSELIRIVDRANTIIQAVTGSLNQTNQSLQEHDTSTLAHQERFGDLEGKTVPAFFDYKMQEERKTMDVAYYGQMDEYKNQNDAALAVHNETDRAHENRFGNLGGYSVEGALSMERISMQTYIGSAIRLTRGISEGVAAQYSLQVKNVDGQFQEIGTIDIPRDMVVQSGSVKTCEEEDVPQVGYQIGDKYMDLVIAGGEANHIYIKLSDLMEGFNDQDLLPIREKLDKFGNGYVIAGAKEGTVVHEQGTAEGVNTEAKAYAGHAEGVQCKVNHSGGAHAQNSCTEARGEASHSGGTFTVANRKSQFVWGEYNIIDTDGDGYQTKGQYIEIIGNGENGNEKSNARTLDWDGNEVLAGSLTVGDEIDYGILSQTGLTVSNVISGMLFSGSFGSEGFAFAENAWGTSVSSGMGSLTLTGRYGTGIVRLQTFDSGTMTDDPKIIIGSAELNEQKIQGLDAAKEKLSKFGDDGHIIAGKKEDSILGENSDAFGIYNRPMGKQTFAFGTHNSVSGESGGAFGISNDSRGIAAVAFGASTRAHGSFSTSFGETTSALHKSQFTFGGYNLDDNYSNYGSERGKYIEIVGNGDSNDSRSNARTLDWDGNEVLAGSLTVGGEDGITLEQQDMYTLTLSGTTGMTGLSAYFANLQELTLAGETLRIVDGRLVLPDISSMYIASSGLSATFGITIGETSLNEAQLQALLALIPPQS